MILDLIKKYRSSKPHIYGEYYDSFFSRFKEKPIKLLEIGIEKGSSIRIWNDYFDDVEILAMDNFYDQKWFGYPKPNFDGLNNVTIFEGDQGNFDDLNKIKGSYDIIIDDGSHNCKDHQTSMGVLMKLLKPGGIYVIEDLITQTSELWEKYNKKPNKKDVYDKDASTLNLIKNFNKNNWFHSGFMSNSSIKYICENVGSTFLDPEEKIWFYVKKL